jgi:hypothetical protein
MRSMNGLKLGNKKLLISHCFVDVKWAMPMLMSLSQILFIINNFAIVKPCEPWLAMKLKTSFVEFRESQKIPNGFRPNSQVL